MNSIWNNNRKLFTERFPGLYKLFSQEFDTAEENDFLFPFWKILAAKNNMLSVEENGLRLHSVYNPKQESQTFITKTAAMIESNEIKCIAFFGVGLGYAPVEAAKKFSDLPLIIIEPDIQHILAAFSLFDWTPVLTHKTCIFAVRCPENTVLQLIETVCRPSECAVYRIGSQIAHAQAYYENLSSLFARNIRAEELNTNTLEKFSELWVRNSCMNLKYFPKTKGVTVFKNTVNNPEKLPFLILAAGPSLSEVLPYLKKIKPYTVVICVETALRACLHAGIEPDFIVITDPQYYAYQHIEGLSSPSSIMITESAVYPAVYRFNCRSKIQCSSMFPLGQYFEKQTGNKGILGAGGSVSTTAWDFARLCGAERIFTAGLDLGYPEKQTHIKGSYAEEKIHQKAVRITPAETFSVSSLYSIETITDKNFEGIALQTDSRMKMFAWWFESRLASFPACKTYTLSKKSLYIPGVEYYSLRELLRSFPYSQSTSEEKTSEEKRNFFKTAEINADSVPGNEEAFSRACTDLKKSLKDLEKAVSKGICLCSKALQTSGSFYNEVFPQLDEIDKLIKQSNSKEIIALVFPTRRQLENLFKAENPKGDASLRTISKSKIIYEKILQAVKKYNKYLQF